MSQKINFLVNQYSETPCQGDLLKMIFREFNYTEEETIHAAKRAAIDLSTTEFSEAETIENIAKCVEQLSQLFMQETWERWIIKI